MELPENLFDQVWVINLKRRPDRLAGFWKAFDKSNWPFRKPKVFQAIEGDKVGVPKFWQTGGGSYGCLRSHLAILERAIMDDVESLLILEDDAIFEPTFGKDVAEFLAKVPTDWQCLMLGGQHVNSTALPVIPGVVRAGGGGGIQRTHCYALRGLEIMRALYATWANAAVHCDWVMGPCTAKFNTYAPDPFLVGQANGRSDISGRQNPAMFWRGPTGNEPLVILRSPRDVMESLRRNGWHGGYTRDPATGMDVGLKNIFSNADYSEAERRTKLRHWIGLIQSEVAAMNSSAVCAIWHPDVKLDMVRSIVTGKVVEVSANTVEDALNQLPSDIHVPQPKIIKAVLLRAPKEVMDALRTRGWHNGYWRDGNTGQDNGIRKLFNSSEPVEGITKRLRQITRVLHDEVFDNIPNGVVTLWHEQITKKMIESADIKILEISARTADEAVARYKELTNE